MELELKELDRQIEVLQRKKIEVIKQDFDIELDGMRSNYKCGFITFPELLLQIKLLASSFEEDLKKYIK